MFVNILRSLYISRSLKPSNHFLRLYRNASVKSDEKREPTLNISDSCIKRLKEIAKNDDFLRIIIDGGGCSGFQYRFDLDSEVREDDVTFGREGVKVVVDKMSLDFVAGSTLDFHEELIRASFRIIDNPKAESKCSCGTSFAVKM